MCECCFPNFWAVCVTLISQHMGKKGEGLRIQILDLTWPPLPRSPHRRNPLISALNNNNTCTAQVTTHLVTQSPTHLTAWYCTRESPIRFCSSGNILITVQAMILVFSTESSGQGVVQPVRRKKCPNDPGFKSQVKCPVPHFIPMGTGGQGIDLAAINLHCSVIAILPAYFDRKIFLRNWHILAGRQITSIGRRVCSWTNKINPVSVFMLRVSVTASGRLQTPLSLTKTSRRSRFSQYPFSF